MLDPWEGIELESLEGEGVSDVADQWSEHRAVVFLIRRFG